MSALAEGGTHPEVWMRFDAHLARLNTLLELVAVQLGADTRSVEPPQSEWTDEWLLDMIAASQYRAALMDEDAGMSEEEQIERAIQQYARGGGRGLSGMPDPM